MASFLPLSLKVLTKKLTKQNYSSFPIFIIIRIIGQSPSKQSITANKVTSYYPTTMVIVIDEPRG